MFEPLTFKAILFDFYQTLIEIKTDEHTLNSWSILASFLRYQGCDVEPKALRDRYFAYVEESLKQSREEHPDVDVSRIFGRLLEHYGLEPTQPLVRMSAQLFRSTTIVRFHLYPETRHVLTELSRRFRLGLVSDSQEPYILPELRIASIAGLFETVVISSHYGYRKPDPRLYHTALQRMGLGVDEVLYVGDSWDRDMTGCLNAGINAVWVRRKLDMGDMPDHPSIRVLPDLSGLLSLRSARRGDRVPPSGFGRGGGAVDR